MKMPRRIGYGTLIGTVLIAGALALGNDQGQGDTAPPVIPAEPHEHRVILLHAQRFELDEPYTHWWRAERPRVTTGWLLVLSVNRDLVFPRQAREPVLYVGNQTAERVNVGAQSGHVVAIVPGNRFLIDSPIFFGDPALPEEVGAEHVERQLAKARAAGVRPPTPEQVGGALHDTLRLADDHALRLEAMDLVETYSPQETDLIQGVRVARVR